MLRYIIKRIIFAIPVLIGATFLVFTIMDLAPGDPARIILGSNATEAALASLRDSMTRFWCATGGSYLGFSTGI